MCRLAQSPYCPSAGPATSQETAVLELLMKVCLLSEPTSCHDVTLVFEADNATPMQCAFVGQVEMAKWAVEHPGYTIRKWRCAPAGQVAKI